MHAIAKHAKTENFCKALQKLQLNIAKISKTAIFCKFCQNYKNIHIRIHPSPATKTAKITKSEKIEKIAKTANFCKFCPNYKIFKLEFIQGLLQQLRKLQKLSKLLFVGTLFIFVLRYLLL